MAASRGSGSTSSRSCGARSRPGSVIAELIYAFRLARRELRGGVRGFRVFLACLVLGVGAIAAIGSLRAAVEAGLRADARLLLGGDVSARLTLRPADAAEREFLARSGTLSETASLRAMARSLDGKRRSLIELRAVDAAYPLYGAVVAEARAGPLGTALAQHDGVFGAVMEPAAATRLGLRPGEEFRIGDGGISPDGADPAPARRGAGRLVVRSARYHRPAGAGGNRVAAPRRAGHLRVPDQTAGRRRCRRLDRAGPRRVSASRLAVCAAAPIRRRRWSDCSTGSGSF